MKTSTRSLLPVAATLYALGGCEWIAGIEDTTVSVDAAALPPDGGSAASPHAGDAGALDLPQMIALRTTSNAPGAHHPGLMWIAPEDGAYVVSGYVRFASPAPAVDTTMTLTRNDLMDVFGAWTLALTTMPQDFFIEVQATAGDVVVASASSDESVSVGIHLFFSGPY
jgi:hypothetical protein